MRIKKIVRYVLARKLQDRFEQQAGKIYGAMASVTMSEDTEYQKETLSKIRGYLTRMQNILQEIEEKC